MFFFMTCISIFIVLYVITLLELYEMFNSVHINIVLLRSQEMFLSM